MATIKTSSGREFARREDLAFDLKGNIIKACRVRDVSPADVRDEDILINGPGALQLDSMDAVEIAMMVDRTYGVRIKDLSSAKAAMTSVASLTDHIWKTLERK